MEYSICIRTLGTAGDKYIKLLESIKKLTIQPKEVIVVIPHGYEVPSYSIGIEKIIRSDKGMLLQRIVGYEESTSEYVLLLDDDVEFEAKLVEKLSEPILEKKANITFPIYPELLPSGGIRSVISAFTLGAVPRKKDDYFVKILPSGGYSYNKNLDSSNKYLYSESAPGMCVFAKTQVLKEINLREELWIDNVGYPLREDAVLMYKTVLAGNKSIGVLGIDITHLDGGSSQNNRNLKAAYANGFNHILFWRRFIKTNSKSKANNLLSNISIYHWAISSIFYFTIKFIISRDLELYKTSINGIYEGFKYISNNNSFKYSNENGVEING